MYRNRHAYTQMYWIYDKAFQVNGEKKFHSTKGTGMTGRQLEKLSWFCTSHLTPK